ncbi:MAG: bacterial Ig-like domain-containing protein [Clostridia bacterium]|nr:bacterial Ig-like domain-containing protein [Clostridia bacterium]
MKKLKIFALIISALMFVSVSGINALSVAIPLDAGKSMSTATLISEFNKEYVGSLSSSADEAWYKFTTASADAYYRVDLINYNLPEGLHYYQNPRVQLFDINSKEIVAFYGQYGDGYLSKKLKNNTTYFIKITHEQAAEKGNFEITVSIDYDTAPDEMEKAVDVEINKTITNSLNGDYDKDWFEFTAPVSGNYEIVLDRGELPEGSHSSSRCVNIALFDRYSQTLAMDFTAYGNDAILSVELEKGEIYYIEICMGVSAYMCTGKYAFTISNDNADTPIAPPVATKTLSSICIDSLPTKTTYNIGETLDISGLIVRAKYSDGTSTVITNYEVYGFDSSKAGTCTVMVNYSEGGYTKNATFSVVINEAEEPKEPGNIDNGSFLDSLSDFFNGILEFFAMILEFIIDMFTSLA